MTKRKGFFLYLVFSLINLIWFLREKTTIVEHIHKIVRGLKILARSRQWDGDSMFVCDATVC